MSRHSSPDLGLTEKNMAFARSVVLDVKRDKIMGDHYREIFGGNASRQSAGSMASRLFRAPASDGVESPARITATPLAETHQAVS